MGEVHHHRRGVRDQVSNCCSLLIYLCKLLSSHEQVSLCIVHVLYYLEVQA